jgi:Lecithin:cholesterol acyltransferase
MICIWFLLPNVIVFGIQRTPPVLLFPGFGASRLMKGSKIIYPPTLHDYLLNFDRWKTTIIESNTLTTLPFGDSQSLELPVEPLFRNINYYRKLVKLPNVHPVPYDFRIIDQHDYYTKLNGQIKAYIESIPQPVVFLCHSSGGLVAHWFLHNQSPGWCRKHIHSVFHINVPFGGVVSALEICVRDNTKINYYLGRELFQSLGATIINIPDTRYLNHSVLTVDGMAVTDCLGYFKLDKMQTRYKEIAAMVDSFKASVEGVQSHIVYSTTMQPTTVECLNLHSRHGSLKQQAQKMGIQYGEGDSVVPLSSLLVPKIWQDPPMFYQIRDSEHSSILNQ